MFGHNKASGRSSMRSNEKGWDRPRVHWGQGKDGWWKERKNGGGSEKELMV